ncbi:IclR family transcriptional regulator [Furfurilactobacillus sp. WILCCON 0119]
MTETTTPKPYGTVLVRAKEIMDYLLANEGTQTLKEISDGVAMSKPTTLKILTTMETLGFVTKTAETKNYSLGIAFLAYGQKAAESFDIKTLAAPALTKLRDETNETINLGIVSGTDVILLGKFESPRSVSLKSRIGGRMNLYSSSMGKAILSEYDGQTMADYLATVDLRQIAPNTITESRVLLQDVAEVRERGYSIDDEENEPDIYCLGFPIKKYGKVYGAFSITTPKFRMNDEKQKQFIIAAKQAQSEIEKAL